MTSRLKTTTALALAALVALGACGRKGSLEPPPYVSPDMAAAPDACTDAPAGAHEPIDAEPSIIVPSGTPLQVPEESPPGC